MPDWAITQAEQLVREKQTELDDRAEYRRAKSKELAKSICVGLPLVTVIVFDHMFSFIGNFISLGKAFLKPLGALLFAKSTQHELEFHEWRNKRYRQAFNLEDPNKPYEPPKTVWNTDIFVLIRRWRHIRLIPPVETEKEFHERLGKLLGFDLEEQDEKARKSKEH